MTTGSHSLPCFSAHAFSEGQSPRTFNVDDRYHTRNPHVCNLDVLYHNMCGARTFSAWSLWKKILCAVRNGSFSHILSFMCYNNYIQCHVCLSEVWKIWEQGISFLLTTDIRPGRQEPCGSLPDTGKYVGSLGHYQHCAINCLMDAFCLAKQSSRKKHIKTAISCSFHINARYCSTWDSYTNTQLYSA